MSVHIRPMAIEHFFYIQINSEDLVRACLKCVKQYINLLFLICIEERQVLKRCF